MVLANSLSTAVSQRSSCAPSSSIANSDMARPTHCDAGVVEPEPGGARSLRRTPKDLNVLAVRHRHSPAVDEPVDGTWAAKSLLAPRPDGSGTRPQVG